MGYHLLSAPHRSRPLSSRRTLALTPAHVARVHRPMEDPGPPPGAVPMQDADYHALRDRLLASRPAEAGSEFWVFAYGSLIWKPAGEIAEQRPALLHGWHRKFCFRILRYRGCDERPGLMMTLDRGGAVRGVIQRLRRAHVGESLEEVLRREHGYKPSAHQATWVTVTSEGRRLPALTFVINRQAPAYLGALTLAQQAEMIAVGCGHVGTCAEYLKNTVEHLEALGIHDRYLWALQQMVAERIAAAGQDSLA